ncbi:BTB/POZ domain-containing adapter for CUL3-mediated RhoA degradation protein 3 [Tyrophagus putrescentiae]|nr:BTB/POZ domain-containing adapter for CUL3-mediated RhoA degradation protein 3 [Tyrophagus putrescentiae]
MDEQKFLNGSSSDYCKLNVGGTLYYTTIGTLTKTDTMLRAMFSGRMEVLKDDDGWVLIDRSGKHFGTILTFLRDGSVPLPVDQRELQELFVEAKYYLVQDLISAIEIALDRFREIKVLEPICSVPLIKSKNEESMLLISSNKPAVKLIINRHNNKYSYTSTSDENLLKNLDLFDKLSLKFSNRVLFMKDIVCSNEICCWSFYGNGKKDAEICCTSIVYATDKKHTKVEFPEARIYEEMLNILLYENKSTTDPEMITATSSRVAIPAKDEESNSTSS